MAGKAWGVGLLLLAALCLSGAGGEAWAQAEEAPRVAVLPLDSRDATEEAEAVAEELRRVFVNSRRYVVVDRTLTDQITQEWATQQSGLTDGEKAVQVGRLYNVKMLVTGRLNRFSAGGWQISAVMIDAQTGITRRAETVRHRGDFFGLLDEKVPPLAARLLGSEEGAPQPAAAAAARAPAPPPAPPPAVGAPLRGEWSEGAPLEQPSVRHGTVALGGRVYVIGGLDPDSRPLRRVAAYDPQADTWAALAPLPAPRTDLLALPLEGRIHVIGGRNAEGEPTAEVLVYDPAAQSWRGGPGMPAPLAGAAGAVLDGRLYVAGGETADKELSAEVYVFDPGPGTWSEGPPLPQPLAYAAAATLNGRLYAAGGQARGSGLGALAGAKPQNAVLALKPGTARWEAEAPLPRARSHFGLVAHGGRLHAFGGLAGTFLLTTPYAVWEALEPGGAWAERGEMPRGLSGHGAVSLGDAVYLLGGQPEPMDGVHVLR